MNAPQAEFADRGSGDAITWSIAEVERETGLGKDTLRVWERRYGFPAPLRDAQGERIYPHDQLQRLRLIKRLLDADHRPGKIVPLPLERLRELLSDAADQRAEPLAPSNGGSPAEGGIDSAWIAWLARDQAALMRQSLQHQIIKMGLGRAVDELVAPLCAQVGQAWMRGEISIYQEHLFTELLQSVLREAIAAVDAAGQSLQRQPRVLLTTTPGEQHGLGLLMAECHFALESCERFVLGVSTPIADIVMAAHQLNIDVVALSFSAYASRRDVVECLRQLIDQLPDGVEIWAGGAGVSLHRRFLPELVAVMALPADVSAAVALWRQRRSNLP